MTVRVGIIGAGQRAAAVYQPVLHALAAEGTVQLAAVADTDELKAQRLAAHFGAAVYANSRDLIAADLAGVIVAVPPRVKDSLALDVLRGGKHLFVESPAAQSAARVRRLAREARRRGLVVEIAEDEAFWPTALLQRQRVAAGEIGRVVAVHNDCREFYYHAYARLHVLLNSLPRPARYSGWQALLPGGGKETWRAVRFADGLIFSQRFVHPRSHRLSGRPRWIVAGESGALVDNGQREEHAAGIQYLLARWLAAQLGQGQAAYGIARAERDIALWHGLETAARMPLQAMPAAAAEGLAAGLIAVRQRLARNENVIER